MVLASWLHVTGFLAVKTPPSGGRGPWDDGWRHVDDVWGDLGDG